MNRWQNVLVVIGVLLASWASAQSRAPYRRGMKDAQEGRPYNLRLGAAQFDFATNFSVAYDDNATRGTTEATEKDAVTGRVGVDTGLYWPMTPDLALDFDIQAGWLQNLAGDGPQGPSIRAGDRSNFQLDWAVGDTGTLSLLDRVSITTDSSQVARQAGGNDLRLLNNDAALQYECEPSPLWRSVLRVGREDVKSFDDAFKYLDRESYYGESKIGWNLNADMTLSLYGNAADYTYTAEMKNDATAWEVGIEHLWYATAVSRVTTSVGYKEISFDTDNVPTVQEEAAGGTARLMIDSSLSPTVQHGLTVSYAPELASPTTVNYSEDTIGAYRISWQFAPAWVVGYTGTWLHSREAGDAGETYDLFINGLMIGVQVSRKASLSLQYRRLEKDSDNGDSNYRSNEFTAGLRYAF